MRHKSICLMALAAIGLVGLVPLAATQNQEPASPADLALLVVDKPAAEAAEIAAQLLTEAIRLGGTEREVLRRVAVTTAVLMAGAATEAEEVQLAVATALAQAAGENFESPVVATIARVMQAFGEEETEIVEAALDALPADRRPLAERAANNPRRALGLRLSWEVDRYIEEVRSRLTTVDEWEALATTLPTTTTTTTSTTTTTTTTRPSPTPVGRR